MTDAASESISTTAPTTEEFVGRIFESVVAAMDLFSIYVGEKLGFYRALRDFGPANSVELARRTGTSERYTREWLEQQTTTGILTANDVTAGAFDRTYCLPESIAPALCDAESPLYIAPIGRFLASAIGQAPALLEAYRTGGGVPWEAYGEDMRTAQADFNRPFFVGSLVQDYLSQVPAIHSALSAAGSRVAEIGPGGGWGLVSMARGYDKPRFDGFDLDAASVDLARKNVAEAGLSARVTVHHANAADAAGEGAYDLVCAYECIHDMSDPVSVLAAMRRLVKPGGTVLVMDERVGEEFGAIGDLMERLFYGFSLTVCLPDGMSRQPSAGTGTVMRPQVLREYATRAGFSSIEILPLEHDMFRFYRLVV